MHLVCYSPYPLVCVYFYPATPTNYFCNFLYLFSGGGWKEVIKTHTQALLGQNFAESANSSLLTQQFCMNFDGNGIRTFLALRMVWYGVLGIFQVYWRRGYLWMPHSGVEKHLYNVQGWQYFTFNFVIRLLGNSMQARWLIESSGPGVPWNASVPVNTYKFHTLHWLQNTWPMNRKLASL